MLSFSALEAELVVHTRLGDIPTNKNIYRVLSLPGDYFIDLDSIPKEYQHLIQKSKKSFKKIYLHKTRVRRSTSKQRRIPYSKIWHASLKTDLYQLKLKDKISYIDINALSRVKKDKVRSTPSIFQHIGPALAISSETRQRIESIVLGQQENQKNKKHLTTAPASYKNKKFGFIPSAILNNSQKNVISIAGPPSNCPSLASKRTKALLAGLTRKGLKYRYSTSCSFDFDNLKPKEVTIENIKEVNAKVDSIMESVNKEIDKMKGPIVYFNGYLKSNPKLSEVIAIVRSQKE